MLPGCNGNPGKAICRRSYPRRAIIVQMLPVKTSRTFEEYFATVFAPYIMKQLEAARRVDLVWDDYRSDSLKSPTREKRGSGQRRKVLPSTLMPSDWKGFL